MGTIVNDLKASKQELVDRLNAKISTAIPFIQKRVNLGKGLVTKGNRQHGIMQFYVPASGNAQVASVTSAGGIGKGDTNPLDLTNHSRKSAFYKKECYAQNASDILEYSNFEEIFALEDYKKELVSPRGQRIANVIEKDLVDRNWFKAGGAIVSSSADFLALSKAAAELQSIKATGDWVGYISPMLQSYLATSPLRMEFHAPTNAIEGMYGKSAIGQFANVEWVNEPFMPIFTSGESWGSNVKIDAAVNTQGATEIKLKGLPTSLTKIPKGTPFSITGVYEVTLSGVKQSYEKKFIVQADADVASEKATVKVLPLYFNSDDGYTNTIWVGNGTGIAADTAVKCLVDASTQYYVGLVRDAEAFNWTPFEWPELLALDNSTSSTDELTIQLAAGGEILQRTNVMRMDVPYFGDIVDERAVRTLYIKVV